MHLPFPSRTERTMARPASEKVGNQVIRDKLRLGLPEHPIVDVFAYLCGTAKKVAPAGR